MIKRSTLVAILVLSVLLTRGLASGQKPDGGKPDSEPPLRVPQGKEDIKPPPKVEESQKPVGEGKSAPPLQQIGEKHYRVYDGKGNLASLESILKQARSADVVFLGESHDDPVAHHLQLELFKQLDRQRGAQSGPPRAMALSLEMFERDVQHVLDEYLAGMIGEQHFKKDARAWNNYAQDYRPLVEFAKERKIAVVASNAPRRYVNRVGRLGAESLKDIPDPQKRGLPPLPCAEASPAYAAKFNALMAKMKERHDAKPPPKEPPGSPKPDPNPEKAREPVFADPESQSRLNAEFREYFAAQLKARENAGSVKAISKEVAAWEKPQGPPKEETGGKGQEPREPGPSKGLQAQTLWDASMAYSIAEHLLRCPQAQVIHLNGSFHSEKRMGVPEHLQRYRPGTAVLVVTIVSHKAFPKFDVTDLADAGDFVIVTDPSLPRTFKATAPEGK